MYKRVNRVTGQQKIGPWDLICDLDVRIWTYAQKVVGKIDGKFATRKEFNFPVPLCAILVRVSTVELWRDIYNISDLIGWYPDLEGRLKG